ncbi:quinone-dependent dihydroorotate dehydrogenase [Stakelama tenebrarum]|uniref:Dihydroorotate dehydrogenase (quinone) n=1 Tax=Stakelama tenebrarum TaxID=2711215 RepID=A0A6G6Y252_9SPHN|nr:quinone-dependent dihydroorotate dehydrogenase [Sphingosinithalassobacter tenebrarum]QIG79024.1 quinone-dependent dihydroorotate dehydrogenase [Sphingosinithalassobacter tenebrarum]
MHYPARSLLFALDAETAHRAAISALRIWGAAGTPLAPGIERDARLSQRIAGIGFSSPVGLAAGLDKNAEAIPGLFALGFGSVEVGTLTPRAQPGNPRPRLFRLAADEAVINRMGFNNDGLDAALARIAKLPRRRGALGINVGANKEAVAADKAVEDYVHGVTHAAPHADYLTINVSSPNTPGLRDLQSRPAIDELLAACDSARRLADGNARPLFLKIAPDLEAKAIESVASAAIDHHVDALIVSNTTLSRPESLRDSHAGEAGGLSGKPLAPLARSALRDARAATGGQLPLISAGGIDSGAEAYARIRAGASLVQVYSALVYHGTALPRRIARELSALLRRDGFANIADAVGVDA